MHTEKGFAIQCKWRFAKARLTEGRVRVTSCGATSTSQSRDDKFWHESLVGEVTQAQINAAMAFVKKAKAKK
ncbi:MAG: hypothetical protein WAO76_11520 [Georgfuchsia sp.]